MKCGYGSFLAVAVMSAATGVSAAVSVTNADFESPTLPENYLDAGTPDGWTASDTLLYMTATYSAAFGTSYSGRQAPLLVSSGTLHQEVGTLEANRLYTLTVAVALRADYPHGGAKVALGAGETFSGRAELAATTNFTPVVGTFTDVTITFHTYGNHAALVGKPLYVSLSEVYGGGYYQVAFDNVRLTETQETFGAFVNNPDFEGPEAGAGGDAPNPYGWANEGGGNWVIARANAFGGVAGGTMPSPASGRQACAVVGGVAYQSVGTLAANRLYTLTVAVGRRDDLSGAGVSKLAFSAGATFDGRTVMAVEARPDPAAGTFAEVTIRLHTYGGNYAALVGQPLYIELSHTGGSGQGAFDTIRLAETQAPFEPFVVNPGFESPVVADGWYSFSADGWGLFNGGGVIAMANQFGGTGGGPMPAPAEGRQANYLGDDSYHYQNVGLIASNRIYALTVAVGTRNDMAPGAYQLWFKENDWTGPNLANESGSTPASGTFSDKTITFNTLNGANVGAVGHSLFVTLGYWGAQGAFDNVRLSVKRPPSVTLGASPSYTNLATEEVLSVTSPYGSETDQLTTDAATGSVVLSQAVPAPTYAMLWLTGGDAAKYSALAAELSAGGATLLAVADYEWDRLAERYSGFNMLVKFPGQSDTAFNWDFGFGYSWDGTVVDQVAVSTKPVVGTMIRIY